jgi:maltooligosyltrehalose trehalohydrolase
MTFFSVWAPAAGRADVDVDGRLYPMSPAGRPGWWSADVPGAIGLAGTDYAFRLDGGEPLADPRSPRQPSGPAGRSRTYDHTAFTWTDGRWRGGPGAGAGV